MAHTIKSNSLSLQLFSVLRHAVAETKSVIQARQRYGTILRELGALSDRELEDMGLSRHDIRAVARKAVYGA